MCVDTYTYTSTSTSTYTYTYTYIHIYIYTCAGCLCGHLWIDVDTHLCAHIARYLYPLFQLYPGPTSTTGCNATCQDDIEAVATAHVLRHLLAPHILHVFSILPVVLDVSDNVRKSTSRLTMNGPTQAACTMLLMVCTRECLTSPCMVKWLLQANHVASSCCVLPILGDEEFLVPTSSAAFQRLGEHPDLQEHVNVSRYLKVLGAIFMQIAVHFWPKSYSESALGLKAAQVAQRLQGEQSATLSSLLDMSWFTSQKSVLLETVEELSPVAASSDQ
ncbi:unnamed protein product, partial [Symbiodinium necroappetens]